MIKADNAQVSSPISPRNLFPSSMPSPKIRRDDDPEFPGVLTEPQEYPNLRLNDPNVKNLTPSDVADKVIGGINTGHELSKRIQNVSGNLNIKDGITLFQSSEGLEDVTPTTELTTTINIMDVVITFMDLLFLFLSR
ncbi:MAG: hypothetical protein JSW11_14985 [Candidatus Heimdallarchaeota archaeon]|nr:MAG: hypothetical protein JSW11_14985 [Candidatus Heimdallarchaeota archaeon]